VSFGGADLHCHSTVSDGVEAPAALVLRALEAGLHALALSDHDALHGLPELETAAAGTGLVTVQAAELSTRCEGEDVHLLGLFVDAAEPDLVSKLVEVRRERDHRGEAMVAKLASVGIVLDLAAIRQTVGDGAFGRPHVARALVADGYVGSFDEAFDRYLTKGKPGYVAKQKWTLEDAIRSVHAAGGVAVVAHPIWYRDPEKVVAIGKSAGLDGLEVFHSDQVGPKENEFAQLAARQGLLRSAGSDYHGPPEGRKRVGACRLEEDDWTRLVARARQHREASGRPPLDLSPR